MRTTINHALDLLEQHENNLTDDFRSDLFRIIQRVQSDYLEIIENALSLLIQSKEDECLAYLREEREKLDGCKQRIGEMIGSDDRWSNEFQRTAIEYLFSRARLVDEIRLFPNFALELLERMTLDQTMHETVTFLENAMAGKSDLFKRLLATEI